MAIADIDSCLKSFDYFTATQLYQKYGKDKFLQTLFSKGPSTYNQDRIKRELEALNEKSDAPGFASSYIPENEYTLLPESVKNLKFKKDMLFKEATNIHSRLLQMKPKERGKAVFQLLDMWDEIRALWNQLDHYEQHKVLPVEEVPKIALPLSPVALIKRRNNLRSYLTKGRTKYKAELEQIEKKLEELNG
jgi:hypothetical protein